MTVSVGLPEISAVSRALEGPLGILAALPEEIAGLIELMASERGDVTLRTEHWGQRDFHCGMLHGQSCVVALSGVGKVAAAGTAATLIHRFGVGAIVFVGVAGGANSEVKVGDIVIGEQLIQHDMDASPLFPKFEIPLLERAYFDTSTLLSARLHNAALQFAARFSVSSGALSKAPSVHRGIIASGDQFVSDRAALQRLCVAIPGLLAVDMESAAVAQVCYEHDVPFAVMRSISDGADEHAAMSFARFLTELAGDYARGVLEAFLSEPLATT